MSTARKSATAKTLRRARPTAGQPASPRRAAKKAAVTRQPAAKPAPAPAPAAKPEKRKLVRDSFTIPADEYELIAQLKQRAIQLGREAKKSELLRAGLKALQGMADAALKAVLAAVPEVKTGRPKAKKAGERAGAAAPEAKRKAKDKAAKPKAPKAKKAFKAA